MISQPSSSIMKTELVILLLLTGALMSDDEKKGEEKNKQNRQYAKMTATFTPDQEPEKVLGYVTAVHDHRVEIMSADGSIHMNVQRIGSGHPLSVKEERERVWPVGNPACTIDFMEWVGRAQFVSDDGVVPPEHGRKREDIVNVKVR